MKKILVVEDSVIIRAKFVEYLAASGFKVATASNGEECLKKVIKESFDLILMDLMMPVMDGFEAIRRIRGISALPFTPIIVISSLDDSSDIEKALALGANEYVIKPIDKTGFNARVQAMLHLKNLYEDIRASERKFEMLLQALPDVVYKLDLEGNFVFISNSAKTLGLDPQEIIGKHFSELVHDDDVPLVSSATVLQKYAGKITNEENAPKLFDEKRSINRATRNLEVRLAQKDLEEGEKNSSDRTVMVTIAFSEISSAGLMDPQKKEVVGTVGIIRDITERKRAEEAREQLVNELKNTQDELKKANERLEEKIEEMEKFQKVIMGREEKIIRLKNRIKELEEKRNA